MSAVYLIMSIFEEEFILEHSSSSTDQEILRLLWNSKVRNSVHSNLPLSPKLSQMNSVYITTYSSLNSLFNVIIPSHVCLPNESASFRLSD
jgi:hypothetical protein